MVAQRSTRSAIHDPRDKRLGKLRRKRQQLTLGIAFVLTLIVVAIGLKITGLLNLGSGVAEAQAIESQVDERMIRSKRTQIFHNRRKQSQQSR